MTCSSRLPDSGTKVGYTLSSCAEPTRPTLQQDSRAENVTARPSRNRVRASSVGQDAKQPRLARCAALKAIEAARQAEPGLLDHVLNDGSIAPLEEGLTDPVLQSSAVIA